MNTGPVVSIIVIVWTTEEVFSQWSEAVKVLRMVKSPMQSPAIVSVEMVNSGFESQLSVADASVSK